tara:strand:- start:1149 stop:1346 length:198 start_codon:yes stop_codon:yes gene_type:complete
MAVTSRQVTFSLGSISFATANIALADIDGDGAIDLLLADEEGFEARARIHSFVDVQVQVCIVGNS